MPRKGPDPYHLIPAYNQPRDASRLAARRHAFLKASHAAYLRRKAATRRPVSPKSLLAEQPPR